MDSYKSKNKFTFKVSNILMFYLMILLCYTLVENGATLSICWVPSGGFRGGRNRRMPPLNFDWKVIDAFFLNPVLYQNGSKYGQDGSKTIELPGARL